MVRLDGSHSISHAHCERRAFSVRVDGCGWKAAMQTDSKRYRWEMEEREMCSGGGMAVVAMHCVCQWRCAMLRATDLDFEAERHGEGDEEEEERMRRAMGRVTGRRTTTTCVACCRCLLCSSLLYNSVDSAQVVNKAATIDRCSGSVRAIKHACTASFVVSQARQLGDDAAEERELSAVQRAEQCESQH